MASGPLDLKIDNLRFDQQNPRITTAASQREALQRIVDDQGTKLANLAENIIEEGLSPMDRLLVIDDASATSKSYIVLEGNRRLAALRIMSNPAILTDLEMPVPLKKRLEGLARRFDGKAVEPVACFQMANRAEAVHWIQQRHTGENDGRGIVDWSGEASARFRGRDPALQALDFVRQSNSLTADQRELLSERFPITTLDRLLSTPDVRKRLGVEIRGGKLLTDLPVKEVLKGLRRIALDLAERKINVTKLKSKAQQLEYIGKLPASDLPDLSRTTASTRTVDDLATSPRTSTSALKATSIRSRSRPIAARTVIVAKPARLSITNPKVGEIYAELRKLKLADFPHAISVLLRVFLETSTDHYLTSAKIPLTFPVPGSGPKDKSLRKKIEEAIAHMEASGAPPKDFAGLKKGMSDPKHPLSVDLLHAYTHNRFVRPKESDLTGAWDNALPYFERIWP